MAQLTPPPDLQARIMDEIHYREAAAKLKRQVLAWAAWLAGSWMAFLILLQNFSRQAGQTGFGPMSRLFLSDFDIIKTHLFDYILSLAEALPIISLSLLALALLALIACSLKLLTSTLELKKINTR
jgi:hypothetical protein